MREKTRTSDAKSIDALLKALFVLAKVTGQVLEDQAVAAATRLPLAGSKVRLLKLVAHQGEQPIGQVAKFLGVSDPAVSQLVDSLSADRLVDRRRDPRDRRTAFLRLTAAGRKAVQAIIMRQWHLLRTALKQADIGNMAVWVASVQSLSKALASCDPSTYERYCLQCGAHADGTCVLDDGDARCMFLLHSHERARRMEAKARSRGRTYRPAARRASGQA